MSSSKQLFREICKRIDDKSEIIINPQSNKIILEAVFIEFRVFDHVSFIIKNAIHHLGPNVAHTVVCGLDNYDSIVEITNKINRDIKIIKIDEHNMNINKYNNLLQSETFWNLFTYNKILLYQEDSIIFKDGFERFLEFDYIGAPWKITKQSIENPCVGNGGFSLRSRYTMLSCLKNKERTIKSGVLDRFTKKHCEYGFLDNYPEDIFFCVSCLLYNFKLADIRSAFDFATENIVNSDSFGGHQFWNVDRNWVSRMKKLMNYYENQQ